MLRPSSVLIYRDLAIGQCRLGVHGTCGLNNLWHYLRKISSWVETPLVTPSGLAG